MGGGETGGYVPSHVLKGGRHNIKCNVPHVFLNLSVCVPSKVLYPYEFRLERGLKSCIFSSPNAKIFLGKGAYSACKIQNFLRQGPAPWTPVNTSRKRSVCSLRLQLFEPPNVKNLRLWSIFPRSLIRASRVCSHLDDWRLHINKHRHERKSANNSFYWNM